MEETDGVRSGTGGTWEVAGGGEGQALPQRDGPCGASRASDSALCSGLWGSHRGGVILIRFEL